MSKNKKVTINIHNVNFPAPRENRGNYVHLDLPYGFPKERAEDILTAMEAILEVEIEEFGKLEKLVEDMPSGPSVPRLQSRLWYASAPNLPFKSGDSIVEVDIRMMLLHAVTEVPDDIDYRKLATVILFDYREDALEELLVATEEGEEEGFKSKEAYSFVCKHLQREEKAIKGPDPATVTSSSSSFTEEVLHNS
jgi:hypothetical protein